MTSLRTVLALVAMSLVAALAGCSSPEPDAEAGTESATSTNASTSRSPAGEPYQGYPDSMAVLGHSGATGEGSGLGGSLQNNWATGENPDVNSVYLRLLEQNPVVEGHTHNLAQGGADLSRIYEQALAAVKLDPAPELVLVQAIDNDITCPADDGDLQSFEDQLTRLLTTLTQGLPTSQIFLTVQDSTAPSTDAAMLTAAERAQLGGTGPCAIFDANGEVVTKEVERLEGIIASYDERLTQVCDTFDRCHHDPDAFRYPDNRAFVAPDLNHYSVAGNAYRAEAAWTALQRTGLIPAG
jgi:hypothetical protein